MFIFFCGSAPNGGLCFRLSLLSVLPLPSDCLCTCCCKAIPAGRRHLNRFTSPLGTEPVCRFIHLTARRATCLLLQMGERGRAFEFGSCHSLEEADNSTEAVRCVFSTSSQKWLTPLDSLALLSTALHALTGKGLNALTGK